MLLFQWGWILTPLYTDVNDCTLSVSVEILGCRLTNLAVPLNGLMMSLEVFGMKLQWTNHLIQWPQLEAFGLYICCSQQKTRADLLFKMCVNGKGYVHFFFSWKQKNLFTNLSPLDVKSVVCICIVATHSFLLKIQVLFQLGLVRTHTKMGSVLQSLRDLI